MQKSLHPTRSAFLTGLLNSLHDIKLFRLELFKPHFPHDVQVYTACAPKNPPKKKKTRKSPSPTSSMSYFINLCLKQKTENKQDSSSTATEKEGANLCDRQGCTCNCFDRCAAETKRLETELLHLKSGSASQKDKNKKVQANMKPKKKSVANKESQKPQEDGYTQAEDSDNTSYRQPKVRASSAKQTRRGDLDDEEELRPSAAPKLRKKSEFTSTSNLENESNFATKNTQSSFIESSQFTVTRDYGAHVTESSEGSTVGSRKSHSCSGPHRYCYHNYISLEGKRSSDKKMIVRLIKDVNQQKMELQKLKDAVFGNGDGVKPSVTSAATGDSKEKVNGSKRRPKKDEETDTMLRAPMRRRNGTVNYCAGKPCFNPGKDISVIKKESSTPSAPESSSYMQDSSYFEEQSIRKSVLLNANGTKCSIACQTLEGGNCSGDNKTKKKSSWWKCGK